MSTVPSDSHASPDANARPSPAHGGGVARSAGVGASRRDLRSRAFALHCHGLRPRAIGERLGIPRRTIADWLATDLAREARRHEKLDREMRRRDVIACCSALSADAWDRYEHLTDRAQALLAYAFGDEPHDDGAPLSAAERSHATDVADRIRAALPRYLLLAHHAQREVARLQYLDNQQANAVPPQNIQYISTTYITPDEEDEEDDDGVSYPDASASADAPTPAADPDCDGDEDADEDEDEDEDEDLPDDDTDMDALEALRDRLEALAYHLRQQRAERAAAAALPDPSPACGGGAGVGALSAPDRPATPPDALSPHETGTSDETPLDEIENSGGNGHFDAPSGSEP